MTEKVYIQKHNKHIKVTFHYNTDLIDIMHDFNGFYIHTEKSWQFPSSKLSILRETLKHKMYDVRLIKSKVL